VTPWVMHRLISVVGSLREAVENDCARTPSVTPRARTGDHMPPVWFLVGG
jgi:hypothetical protein